MAVAKPSNRDRRAASIEAVLNAAQYHFVAGGYHGTTMDQIAGRAGLTKGAVYFYFKDKSSLLEALLDRVESRIFTPLFEILGDRGLAAQERLVIFLHRQSVAGGEHAEMLLLPVVMSKEFSGSGDPIAGRVEALYDRLYAALERLVEDGQRSGEFWRHAGAAEQASIIVAMHDGMLLEWLRRGGKNRVDPFELVRAFRLTMLKGLSRADHESPAGGIPGDAEIEPHRLSG